MGDAQTVSGSTIREDTQVHNDLCGLQCEMQMTQHRLLIATVAHSPASSHLSALPIKWRVGGSSPRLFPRWQRKNIFPNDNYKGRESTWRDIQQADPQENISLYMSLGPNLLLWL